jgi:6-phosphogluconolactonase
MSRYAPGFSVPNRALPIIAAIGMLLALAGCGSGGHFFCGGCGPSPAEFLFATTNNGQIVTFAVDPGSGALTVPSSASVAGPAQTLGMAASGSQFLYASDSQNAQLYGYSINQSTGALTAIAGSPFSTGSLSVPVGLGTSPGGNILYATDVDRVDVFAINATTGVLTATAGSTFSGGEGLQLAISPAGKFLFETDIEPPYGTLAFTVASSGTLTEIAGSPFAVPGETGQNSNPFGIVADASGKFVFMALSLTGQIAAWSVDQTTGALTPVPGSPFTSGSLPTFLLTVNKYLYASAGGSVYAYTIDSTTGALTPVNGSPFTTAGAGGLAADPPGAHLYVSSAAANGISGFNINGDGSLTPIAGSPFAVTGALLLTVVETQPPQ